MPTGVSGARPYGVRGRALNYNLNNVLLILSQRPDASRVAGFRQWQERGRQVRKGERAIEIFGYATKRIEGEDGEEERRPQLSDPQRVRRPDRWRRGRNLRRHRRMADRAGMEHRRHSAIGGLPPISRLS